MADDKRTRKELTEEVVMLRAKIAELEQAMSDRAGLNHSAILDEIPDLAWLKDTEGRYVAVNRAFAEACRVKPEALLGKTDVDLWPRELAEKYMEDDREVIRSGEKKQLEEPVVGPCGSKLWVETVKTPVYGPNGEISGVAGLARDITLRKQAEELLLESEERFRNFAEEASAEGIMFHDMGKIIDVNLTLANLHGYTPAELIGMNTDDLVAPGYKELVSRNIRESYSKPYEFLGLRKDGTTYPIEAHGKTILYHGKKIRSVAVRDITERKQAEESLRKSEARFRKLSQEFDVLLNTIPDNLALLSPDQRVVWTNRAVACDLGKEVSELIGNYCYEIWRNRLGWCADCPVQRSFRTGTPESGEITSADGKIWEVRTAPVFDENGKVANVIEVVREITRERNVEAQLRQAQKMEAIGTLAGGIAHDFNNILAVMMGYTEMSLSRAGESDYVKSNLVKILTCIRRAGDLVKQILTFSRQTEQEKRPIELAPAIEEAVKLIRASIPANIEIRQNIAALPNRFVLAEPTQIHQVVLNLCANAAHAMRKKGGLLEVSLTEEVAGDPACALVMPPGPCLKLTVRDTGCGIDPSILDRIFDPFFTTKEVGEGTGMGLSVTHGIVKSHGGTISVTSEPGSGATFEIHLPQMTDPVPAHEAVDDFEPAPTGTGRILLVDDEWMLADVGRKLLVKLGYSVEAFTDSAEALDLFRAEPHRFDLVITDLTMPHIMGLELAAFILRIRPDIPVILCTGYNQNISGEDVKAAGISGIVTKPFTLRTIGSAVRKALADGRNRNGV